ncbi:cyclin-like protein interacting with PHO85 [Leucoagaricus gongylophorus]
MLALVHPSVDVYSQGTASVTTQIVGRQALRRSSSSATASSSGEGGLLQRSTTSRKISAARRPSPPRPVNVHSYPTTDLVRLLASLLTQIASTNDQLGMRPNSITTTSDSTPIHPHHNSPLWLSLTTASRSAISTPASTLTFHARNIPTISLEAYFLRILKYCPTTNEVFLALLVYFDRMSKLNADATARTFVIDSYNIHRLVIAGVTVASKFFSDVFYTNSRYAKVGGLPLSELNQLELHFLLLNDFRLVISSDEMQRYAEQLILFSRSSGVLAGDPHAPHPLRNAPTASGNSVAAPMSAMGAIDAYGGKTVDERPSTLTKHPKSYSHFHPTTLTTQSHQNSSTPDDDETGTEIGTEDSSSVATTDDEPTIRANSVVNRGSEERVDEAMRDTTHNISSGQVVLIHTSRCDDNRTPETMTREERMPTSP